MQNDIKNAIIIEHGIYLICYVLMLRNKKIIVLMLFAISLCMNVSLVSADKSDCGVFATMSFKNNWWEDWFSIVNLSWWTDSNKYSNFLSTEQQLAIINKESLNTAMLNLKKYCCEKGIWWPGITDTNTCENDKELYNDNIIDSPYLFDHLFDVVMRRLSGLTGEYDIYTKLEMWSDDKWLEWRAWLNSQAENLSWANPQIISDKYEEFWKKSSPDLWYDITDKVSGNFGKDDSAFLDYVSGRWGSEESESVAEALKNYDKWTLYDRYDNACAVTQYLYSLLNLAPQSEDKVRVISTLSKWACNKIVKNQIENENSYVQVTILQAGNLFLQNYRQWYISYLYDRSQNLQKIWSDATDRLLDVVRGVPHLVKTCVK